MASIFTGQRGTPPPVTLEVKITILNGMSTVHSLPNELLEKMFEAGAYLPPSFAEDYPWQRCFSNIPVQPAFVTSLSQVYRRWRDISHRLPNLWGFLHPSPSMETYRRLKDHLNKS